MDYSTTTAVSVEFAIHTTHRPDSWLVHQRAAHTDKKHLHSFTAMVNVERAVNTVLHVFVLKYLRELPTCTQ